MKKERKTLPNKAASTIKTVETSGDTIKTVETSEDTIKTVGIRDTISTINMGTRDMRIRSIRSQARSNKKIRRMQRH
jgi:hypothetical protein